MSKHNVIGWGLAALALAVLIFDSRHCDAAKFLACSFLLMGACSCWDRKTQGRSNS